ncbi:hypothetical protein [Nitrospira sp. BLG_2]|uniref:hypothetical protein n=1 Tax=Nitrospira sp. BLG_2 TaxID=3397507 RepID=UPI003B9F7B83
MKTAARKAVAVDEAVDRLIWGLCRRRSICSLSVRRRMRKLRGCSEARWSVMESAGAQERFNIAKDLVGSKAQRHQEAELKLWIINHV